MISVVVPVYNMGKVLPKCIGALLSQSYDDYEIILVNDGSTDGSGEACDQEAKKSEKIRVIHKANGGLSSARNCGIDQAKGEFIIFPDPDDWEETNYLEYLLAIKEKANADLSICGYYRYTPKGEFPEKLPPDAAMLDAKSALKRLVLPSDFSGYVWNKLFSMKTIRDAGLRFDEELQCLQDLHFCFRYFQYCDRIVYDPKPLYHYNINTGVSSFSSPISARKLSAFKAYEKIAMLAKESLCPELENAVYGQLYERSLKYIYPYYYNKTNQPDLLDLLKHYLKKYKKDFFTYNVHSWKYTLLARVALISPKAYYYLLRVARKLDGLD